MTRELTVGQTIGLGVQLLLTVVMEPMNLAIEAPVETTPITIERVSPADEARDYCVRQPEIVREEVAYERTGNPELSHEPAQESPEVHHTMPDIVEELPELGEKADPEVLTELVVDPPDPVDAVLQETLARQAAQLETMRETAERLREERARALPEGPERETFRANALAVQAEQERRMQAQHAEEVRMIEAAKQLKTEPTFTPKEI